MQYKQNRASPRIRVSLKKASIYNITVVAKAISVDLVCNNNNKKNTGGEGRMNRKGTGRENGKVKAKPSGLCLHFSILIFANMIF